MPDTSCYVQNNTTKKVKRYMKVSYIKPTLEVIYVKDYVPLMAGSKQIKVSNSTTAVTSDGSDYDLEIGGENNSGDWGAKKWTPVNSIDGWD